MTERMFIIIGVFLCGYCLGYYSFDIFKYKNRKHQIRYLFQVIIKNMACSIEFLTEKMEEVKIADDISLGNDLSYEENVLNHVIEKFGKELKDCKVSFYLHRKNMSICCEALTMTETIGRKSLKIVDRLMDGHFFSNQWFKTIRVVCTLHA